MRRLTRSLLALNLALGGCQFPWIAVHNLRYEYDRCVDDHKNEHDISNLAARTWLEVVGTRRQGAVFSEDYHAGFIEGFSYFVLRGGDGEPPPVPPQSYWTESFRSPQGYARIQDWFSGYRHGTHVAQEGHFRDREMLELSRPLQEDPVISPQPQGTNTLPFPRQVNQ